MSGKLKVWEKTLKLGRTDFSQGVTLAENQLADVVFTAKEIISEPITALAAGNKIEQKND